MEELIWNINGKYFKDFGVFVSDSKGIMDEPNQKKTDTYDWAEYNGLAPNLQSKPKYEVREFELACWVKGADWLEMRNNFDALMAEFRKARKQRLTLDIFGEKTYVWDVNSNGKVELKKQIQKGVQVGVFTIKLIEYNPIKKIFKTTSSILQLAFNSPRWIEVNIDGKSEILKGSININKSIPNVVLSNYSFNGRNLLLKTDFKNNTNIQGWYAPNSRWFNDDSISIDYVPSGQAYYELSQSLISVDSDTEYTLSFFAKGEVSSDYDVQVYLVEGNATTPNIKDNFKVFKVNNSKYFLCSTTIKTSANTTKVSVIFRNIPSNNGTLFFKKPKLEKGNKATDWTPAPEDVQTQIDTNSTNTALALAQAQNAINTANNVAVITSFLQTSILGNVVATGTLLVGDVLGAKAGITGVTDRAGKSVRLFAGANYTGKNIANWNVLDDGTMNFHHPNGQIAFEFGLSNGRFVMNGYHESGYKIFELSPSRGLVNVAYIPESWTVVELFFSGQTNAILNESAAKDYIENLVRIEMTGGTEVGQEAFWNYLLDANFSCFDYQNGTHPDYTQYADLVGYKTINNNRNNNIDNGWYGLKTGSIDGNFGDSRPILYTNYILYYIYNGKITNTKIINLVI